MGYWITTIIPQKKISDKYNFFWQIKSAFVLKHKNGININIYGVFVFSICLFLYSFFPFGFVCVVFSRLALIWFGFFF